MTPCTFAQLLLRQLKEKHCKSEQALIIITYDILVLIEARDGEPHTCTDVSDSCNGNTKLEQGDISDRDVQRYFDISEKSEHLGKKELDVRKGTT